MEERGMQAASNEIYYSHGNQTMEEEIYQEKNRYHMNLYEDWIELFEWQSVCHSTSITKKLELMYLNGKLIQSYQYPAEFKKGWGDYPLILSLMINWRGEITDLNIYDSAFEKEQMVRWTTSCDIPKEGEILAWLPNMFNLTNNNVTKTTVSEVASEDLCPNKNQEILEIFDDGVPKSPVMGDEICTRLNGRLNLVPSLEEELVATIREFEEYLVEVNQTGLSFWVGGMNEGEWWIPGGGSIKDPYTDAIRIPFLKVPPGHGIHGTDWIPKTPVCLACGGTYNPETLPSFGGKLCRSQYDCVHSFLCYYQKCERNDMALGLMCKFEQKLRLRLKGLCKETKVDTDYLLLGYEVLKKGGAHKRKYGGSTGWVLAHDKEQDLWQLQHHHYPHLTISMEDRDSLPVGIHSWIAANNTCSLGQTVRFRQHCRLTICRLVIKSKSK